MTDTTPEDMDRAQRQREQEQDELLQEQNRRGYVEDEGDREEAVPDQ